MMQQQTRELDFEKDSVIMVFFYGSASTGFEIKTGDVSPIQMLMAGQILQMQATAKLEEEHLKQAIRDVLDEGKPKIETATRLPNDKSP